VPGVLPSCVLVAGEAEVAQDGLPVGTLQDVGGLDVAVHEAFFVRVLQRCRDLRDHRNQFAQGTALMPALFAQVLEAAVERLAVGELHRQEVLTTFLANLENAQDARMVEAREVLRFAAEPRDRRRPRDEVRGQDLQRHAAVQ
jgi:hypothetical protein